MAVITEHARQFFANFLAHLWNLVEVFEADQVNSWWRWTGLISGILSRIAGVKPLQPKLFVAKTESAELLSDPLEKLLLGNLAHSA
jgi:hypothetical protein